VAVFAVAPSNGALTPLAWEDGKGQVDFPRHISLAAGGSLLLVS
jgi:6-phosphogluconolactonase (cycloisomerase 2 family)